jgi:hypothetical protein
VWGAAKGGEVSGLRGGLYIGSKSEMLNGDWGSKSPCTDRGGDGGTRSMLSDASEAAIVGERTGGLW